MVAVPVLSVRFSDDEKQRLRMIAGRCGLSVSALIRDVVARIGRPAPVPVQTWTSSGPRSLVITSCPAGMDLSSSGATGVIWTNWPAAPRQPGGST